MTDKVEKPKEIMFAQACNMALAKAMADDPKVILLGEDIADEQGGGVFKVTASVRPRFPNRLLSAPRLALRWSATSRLLKSC